MAVHLTKIYTRTGDDIGTRPAFDAFVPGTDNLV